jgi:hypothetical protein
MRLSGKIQRWRQALFRKQELDAQMEAAMRSHIELQTQENIEAGMTPEEARRKAKPLASGRTPRSSAWSMPSCSGRCPIPNLTNWCSCA